jgi:glucose/arabinose dehydrogenase
LGILVRAPVILEDARWEAVRAGGNVKFRRGTRLLFLASVATVVSSALTPAAATGSGTSAQRGELFASPGSTTGAAAAAALPAGFQDLVVWSGLTNPTAIAFAPGGKVFVGLKGGVIEEWPSISATNPIVFTDLSTEVDDFWDRGLLGLAVDPQFGTAGHDYVYVLYTYDAPPNRSAPVWNDVCFGSPNGPGATTDGCVVTGRLSRLPVNSDGTAGPEQVLIGSEWCQQFPSHSVGHLAFLPDGSLLVSGGDGANFNSVDYGQKGGTITNPATGQPYTPRNPCGDPPGGYGVANTSPTGRGGSLRSQSLRRPTGEPTLLNGTLLRVDPATGDGLPGNPLYDPADPSANRGRIVAYGLRNPFRFTIRPGTSETWVGDVGQDTWEEVDRLGSPTPPSPVNFGWPCYEGAAQLAGYTPLDQCTALYADTNNPASLPYFTYKHGRDVATGDGCQTSNGSVISGISFYDGGDYPAAYDGALFFGDHSRNCMWAMLPGANGLPDPGNVQPFVVDPSSRPVDIETEPASGDLFYVSHEGGQIRRIHYFAGNQPPIAVATASPTYGPLPLTVDFDGTDSSDPDGTIASYSWNFGDGTSATGRQPSHTYTSRGPFQATLRVRDNQGKATTSQPIAIDAGNTPPDPVIDAPAPTLEYAAGEEIAFSGNASDQQDGDLTGSSLVWTLIVHHCTDAGCHRHVIGTVGTGTGGSVSAPDHAYPSHLELQLTATDSGGLSTTTSVTLQPRTVLLTFQTLPVAGLRLTVDSTTQSTPFTITTIAQSNHSVTAITPQKYRRKHYVFVSWSDGGAADHDITAPMSPKTYTAAYVKRRRATAG